MCCMQSAPPTTLRISLETFDIPSACEKKDEAP
jgi:hypothetical protein